MKNKYIDLAILFCVFMFCVSFPFAKFIENSALVLWVEIAIRAGFAAFLIIYSSKTRLFQTRKIDLKNLLLLMPLILILPNNLYFLVFEKASLSNEFSSDFAIQIIYMLVVAVSEELYFRKVLLDNINIENRLLKIIISSAIFGISHIVNFFNSFNPIDLLIIVYTFGISIILGFIYEYGGSLTLAIIFHFVFNILNTTLFETIYLGDRTPLFYVVSCSVAAFGIVYLLIIYLTKLRHEKSID